LTLARQKLSQYYFGKELRHIARGLIQTTIAQIEDARAAKQPEGSAARRRPPLDEAQLFLNVLDRVGDSKLNAVEIVAFDISNYGRSGHRFFNSMQSSLRDRKSTFHLKLLDAATILAPEHYYRLDGHLNAEGHRVLAEAILGVMDAP
jgi:lysophospholipase L1-like esterase